MNSGPVSSSPASGSASSSNPGPTIGVPERKYIPYRQGAEEQLKLTVGNRAGRALKAPTTPVMSSSKAVVESLLAPEPGPEKASSPRYCSALRERCVSLSNGTVTVTPTTGGSRDIITWQQQQQQDQDRIRKNKRTDWKENLDHLLEVVEVEADSVTAPDAAGTTGTTGTTGTQGTNITTPLLVAQVPQSAPAAAVVPGAVPSPTSGPSQGQSLSAGASWISSTGTKTGKEGRSKPSIPFKPPLHRVLPLAQPNSNARPGRDNNDVNRNNKWEEVPGSNGDGRDLGSQSAASSCCQFKLSGTSTSSPSSSLLFPPPPPLSSPASRPRLQLQACISSRAGENVDDPQQPKGSEDGSSGSIGSRSKNHEKPNHGSSSSNSNSLSRQQEEERRNKGGDQSKGKLEDEEKKGPYPPVPIPGLFPSASSSAEPAAHTSPTTTTTTQQHPTRKQTQTQKQTHSYLGPDLHPKTRNWLEQVFKDTVGNTAVRERELTHSQDQDHHHPFLLPLPLVSGWDHSPFDLPATDHGRQPVNGAEERPRLPRHTQAEQAGTAQIKGQAGLAHDQGSSLNDIKGTSKTTNISTRADGLASQTLQTSVPRLNTGADSQTLAERCKLETDMIMDHQHHSSAVPLSPAPSHSSFSLRGRTRVFGKLPFLSRSRKPEGPTRLEISSPISPLQEKPETSPTSPVSPASSMGAPIDKIRSRSRDAKTYAGSGGRGVVPVQDEVPKGAINGADRRVTVRCKGVTVDLKVEVDTTTVDILLAYADKTGIPVNVNTSMVIEAYTPLGLERRLRRYERIRDVINSWDQDMQNVLIIQTENDRSDENLDLAHVSREHKIPNGFVLPLQHSCRPGKWNKRYITLLENGQLVSSKKPDAKLSDKDVLSICHLSDFDIYTPTEAQKRKELRPPKKHCYAIKSQQKTTIFQSTDNFVHYFSTEDAAVAQQFFARVQAWRSWYLVNKVLQLHKKKQEREAEQPPQLSSSPHKPRIAVKDVSVDGHKIRVSVDESPYPIGTFKPLIDLQRFDKPIDEFGKDWESDRPRQHVPPLPPLDKLQKARRATQEEKEAPFGSSGLLGNAYEERKQAQKEEERKRLEVITDQPFTDRPSLLNGGLVTSPIEETGQHEGRSEPKAWLPSAVEHTATQRSTRAPSVRRSAPSNQSPPSHYAPSQHTPSQYAPSQYAPSQYAPSQYDRGRESHRRQQRKPSGPLVDLTPKFVEPPQWSKEGLGRGVKAPEGVPLVDMATAAKLAPGAKPLDLPPRTLVRREPSVRAPGSRPGTSGTQVPPGSSAGSVRAVSWAPSVRSRMTSRDGPPGGGRAYPPPVPPIPGSVLGNGSNYPPSSRGRDEGGFRPRTSSGGQQPPGHEQDHRQRTFSLRNQPHPLLSFDEALDEPRGLLGNTGASNTGSMQRSRSVRVGNSSGHARNGSLYNY
ncbi:hypothetical protein B0T20DRAFT_486273 [Sordaria brevicollis]|uniref:PH domain-containing protein n=1 Tax=Sordaria brevicollis TaxID=83679 RepID=A0AAE0PP20_SORBR|nr:hypothetical protein B0T20DRAFT_486273 [Sordaria brevicollis]